MSVERHNEGLFAAEAASGAGWVTAHCDGGARGNPGPAGFGAVLADEHGAVLAELSEFLGVRTNNYAEYSGLLAVLAYALEHNYRRLRVVSDSELMVKQIQGKYKVNSPDLKPLWQEAKARIARLDGFEISHALRHKNKDADRLANLAMDRGMKRPRAVGEAETPLQAIPYPKAAAAAFSDQERNAQALDWSILRDGGIALYLKHEFFDEDIAWLSGRGYKIASFDCARWNSSQKDGTEAMHEDLAKTLCFPSYYGKNASALNDCLQEDLVVPGRGLVLTFKNFDKFHLLFSGDSLQHSVSYMLLDVLARAIRFHSLLGRRMMVMVQTSDPRFCADGLGAVSATWNRREWLSSARGL